MTNYTTTPNQIQETKQHSAINWSKIHTFTPHFDITEDHFITQCHLLPQSRREVLTEIILGSRLHTKVFYSHATLSRKTGYSVATVKRAIEELKYRGLLRTYYYHEESLIYQLPLLFKQDYPSKAWAKLLRAYQYFCIHLIAPKRCLAEGELLYSTEGIYFKTNTTHNNTTQEYITSSSNRGGMGGNAPQEGASEVVSTLEPVCDVVCDVKKERGSVDTTFIPEVIKNIQSLRLTLAGQINLLAYPDEAIKYADANFKYSKEIKDPFKFFCGIASKYVKENSLERTSWKAAHFKQVHNVQESDVLCEGVNDCAVKKVSQKGEKANPLPEGAPTYEASLRSMAQKLGFEKFKKMFRFQGLTPSQQDIARGVIQEMEREHEHTREAAATKTETESIKRIKVTEELLGLGRWLARNTPQEKLFEEALKVERNYKERYEPGTPNPWLELCSEAEQKKIHELVYGLPKSESVPPQPPHAAAPWPAHILNDIAFIEAHAHLMRNPKGSHSFANQVLEMIATVKVLGPTHKAAHGFEAALAHIKEIILEAQNSNTKKESSVTNTMTLPF